MAAEAAKAAGWLEGVEVVYSYWLFYGFLLESARRGGVLVCFAVASCRRCGQGNNSRLKGEQTAIRMGGAGEAYSGMGMDLYRRYGMGCT